MAYASSLSAYEDIKAILDTALDEGLPLHYALGSPKAAIRWRARANAFRKISEVRAYKSLVFSIRKEEPSVIVIEREEPGTLFRPDGEAVPVRPIDRERSEEEIAAEDLARELGVKL